MLWIYTLSSMLAKFESIDERLANHEGMLHEIQPRLSILYDDKEDNTAEDNKNSLRDSPDSSVNQKDMDKRKNSRMTMFQRNVEETTKLSERHAVIVQRPTPSHEHIKLTSTDLAEYAQFVNKWFDWEIKHGIKLEPALIVAEHVRNQLMYNNGYSETDIQALTPAEFCSMMAHENKFGSKPQFAETLRYATRHTPVLMWHSMRPSNHERYFQGILKRQKLFLRTFQILMEANKHFCPTLEGKEFGLAQIFLDLIDKEYNKYIQTEILKPKDQNFKKLSDFTDAYVAKAKTHFDLSRSVQLVPYKIAYQGSHKETTYDEKSRYNSGNKAINYHS